MTKKREKRKRPEGRQPPGPRLHCSLAGEKYRCDFTKDPSRWQYALPVKQSHDAKNLLISDEHGRRCAGRGTRELAMVKRMAQEAPRQN
jgi:hypothetical protein